MLRFKKIFFMLCILFCHLSPNPLDHIDIIIIIVVTDLFEERLVYGVHLPMNRG